MSRVYCVKCRKLGLITCMCVASAMSVTAALTDGPAPAHAIGIAAADVAGYSRLMGADKEGVP